MLIFTLPPSPSPLRKKKEKQVSPISVNIVFFSLKEICAIIKFLFCRPFLLSSSATPLSWLVGFPITTPKIIHFCEPPAPKAIHDSLQFLIFCSFNILGRFHFFAPLISLTEQLKTRFENEVRSYCKSWTNLKVVKWG